MAQYQNKLGPFQMTLGQCGSKRVKCALAGKLSKQLSSLSYLDNARTKIHSVVARALVKASAVALSIGSMAH